MGDNTNKPGRKTGTGQYYKSLTFSVDEETFNKIHALAENRHKPASELLRDALEQYLKREGKGAK